MHFDTQGVGIVICPAPPRAAGFRRRNSTPTLHDSGFLVAPHSRPASARRSACRRGQIQVHSQTEVRKLLSESHPRLVRHKRFPFHRVIRHHDPLVLSAVEEFTPIQGAERYRPTGAWELRIASPIRPW